MRVEIIPVNGAEMDQLAKAIEEVYRRREQMRALQAEWMAWADDLGLSDDDLVSIVASHLAIGFRDDVIPYGPPKGMSRLGLLEGVYLACQSLGEAQDDGWTPECGLTLEEYGERKLKQRMAATMGPVAP